MCAASQEELSDRKLKSKAARKFLLLKMRNFFQVYENASPTLIHTFSVLMVTSVRS